MVSGFPYFLQFESEFGNKELMIWSSYTYIKSCPRTQHWPFYSHSAFEANGKGKKLNKWNASCADQKEKKKCRFEVLSSLNLCNSNEHFLIRLWRATKSGLCKTTSDDQLRGWTKKKLQSTSQRKLAPKKAHVHCFVACCPSDPLRLSEFLWNHYIWEACSTNWCDALKLQCLQPALANRKDLNSSPWHCPTAYCTANTSEVERIGLQSFASSAIFTWPLANFATLLLASWQLFSGEILPQPTGCRKCFPRVQWIWNTDFYATGINQVISH